MEVYHHGGRDIPPLIKVRHLSCDASIIGLLTGPRLENIRLNGLEIRVSREDNNGGEGKRGPEEVMDRSEVRSIDVQEIVADGTMLQIAKAAGKQLLTFDIQKLTVYRVAAD